MPFSEFEIRKIRKLMHAFSKRRSRYGGLYPCEIDYRLNGNEVRLLERRPRLDKHGEWNEFVFARAVCDLQTKTWKLYWQDQCLGWRPTSRLQSTRCFEKVLEHIDRDSQSI